MLQKKVFSLNALALTLICGSYASTAAAAPTLKVLNSTLQGNADSLYIGKTLLSDDGRFLFLAGNTTSQGVSQPVNMMYDLYRNRALNIATAYNTTVQPLAVSANGRYLLSDSAVIDLKYSTFTTVPSRSETLSDSGRYIGFKAYTPEHQTHGYVYDRQTAASTLATPKYGTSDQLVPPSIPNNAERFLLSGDGKTFFWSSEGTTGFVPLKPHPRDIIAHKWGVGSTVNQRVSNCNGCDNNVTDKGSDAYAYNVSADGNIAAFVAYDGKYGFTTASGSSGDTQIYARNLSTLKVDLISISDTGYVEEWAEGAYEYPSISSDGRFVVFNNRDKGATYIRDRFAKKKQQLDAASTRAFIAGDGKSIVLQKADGWYTLANPYLVTTSNFTSNYLFVNALLNGSTTNKFDHLLLTDNNIWTGYLDYSGSGASNFKLETGGQWNTSGTYIPGSPSSPLLGDNNSDGTAGNNEIGINLSQGAGRYKITFNDQTNQYTVKKLADVNFNCYNGFTNLGQSVYITGNIPELGNWSPANAVKLSATTYPTWKGTLALPTNTNIEWKCIKRDELNPAVSLVWESGGNNQFNPSSSQTTDGHF